MLLLRSLLFFLFVHAALTAGIPVAGDYSGPTEQLIKRESWKSIEKKLTKMGIPEELYPYFDKIAEREDWGHIGYHGSNQSFRVYQDIIRFVVEEILSIPVREDFHFLRIPGDEDLSLNSVEEFASYWGDKLNNKNKKRAKQLVSLNYSIYSNFDNEGSCSLIFFVNDSSKNEVDYAGHLVPFFEKLGLNPKALKKLFAVARKSLDQDRGILLRIYENTHLADFRSEAYNFADLHCYPCKRAGYRYGSQLLSNHFQRMMSSNYIEERIDISPQLRLLMNNAYTLNPFSYLCVERCDLQDQENVRAYEQKMRSIIRKLKYDSKKVRDYQKYLIQLWIQEDLK